MTQVISNETVVVAVRDQVSSDLGGEAVILHLGKGAYYGVNEVGTFVWNLLQKPIKVSDIEEQVTHKYQVGMKVCETDLLELLHKLLRAKLIEINVEKRANQ